MQDQTKALQLNIFEWLKKNVEFKEPMVYELSELFQVSQDSIYRRMRGEKMMTLEELLKLYDTFDFSLEDVVSSSASRVVFSFQPIMEGTFSFIDYLVYINNMLQQIANCTDKTLYYLANDVPLFHMLNTPSIAAFKLFFWQKTILGFQEFKDKRFNLEDRHDKVNHISREIRDAYFRIPTVEIYSQQTIDTTLRQIEFYLKSGHFENAEMALFLCDEFVRLMQHIKLQCEQGVKFKIGEQEPHTNHQRYEVYFNEVLYSDTTILVNSDDQKMTYLTNNGLNVLRTDSEAYYNHSLNSFQILKRKSIGISEGNDRERNRIFRQFENQILRFKEKLSIEIKAEKML